MNNFEGPLSKQMLKCMSGEFDIESIHTLVLKEMDISDLGCLGECTGLERLDLSKNDVTKLYALAGLTNLIYLNLSANRITSLEGLQALDNLTILNLSGNLIGSVDTLRCLQGLEKLEDLRLKDELHSLSNPVCLNTSYRSDVLNILPGLKTLDGERVRGRGSELFMLCTDLDRLIAEREGKDLSGHVPVSSTWIAPGFWDNTSALQYETAGLERSERQLKGLIDECRHLAETSDEKIRAATTTHPAYITDPGS